MKKMMMNLGTASILLLAAAISASAQSEISPDHFPDPSVNITPQASLPPASGRQAQIAAEEAQLKGYEAQIREKERQVEADYQAATLNYSGDEAGQLIAYSEHQKECEHLKLALAPKINEARATLASLEKSAGAPAKPAARVGSSTRGSAKHTMVLVASARAH